VYIPLPLVEKTPQQTRYGYTDELPPPLIHSMSPYCTIPLPSQVSDVTEVVIHPVLRRYIRPRIYVDFSLAPTADVLPPHCLVEPATCPNLPSLTVMHPDLPVVITVHASSINPSYVTVADILNTVRSRLSFPVTEWEYLAWVADSPNSQWSDEQGHQQFMEHGAAYSAGVTMLSFLAGNTRFVGLVPSSMGSDVWVLEVMCGNARSH